MISLGIDVAKGKSTVCILKPYGEIFSKPFDIAHTEKDLNELSSMLLNFDDEVKVVMEATGIYHLPVLTYLQERGIFVAVINPYLIMELNIGLQWKSFKLLRIYSELKLLGQQYRHYMKLHIVSLHELTHLLDYTMPGIKGMLASWNEGTWKDKLSDFVERFWHFDMITVHSEHEFIKQYQLWAKEKKYHQSQDKAKAIYSMALNSIPTLSSETPSVKMLVTEAVRVLKEVDATLSTILSRMQELAKSLPEYSVVREMGGVGDVLAPKLIAEIEDVRRFHSGKALIAYAGIDTPPYESGQFVGKRPIVGA